MKDRLIDILINTHLPIMRGEDTVGEYSLSCNVAEKLADELINSGVTLPTFKVGDIVWVYDFMWGIVPCEVVEPYLCRFGTDGKCTFEMRFSESDVGIYVFDTRESAEAEWKEKKGK